MYSLVKKFLFRYDPEDVHYKVLRWLTKAYNTGLGKKYLTSNYSYNHKSKKINTKHIYNSKIIIKNIRCSSSNFKLLLSNIKVKLKS